MSGVDTGLTPRPAFAGDNDARGANFAAICFAVSRGEQEMEINKARRSRGIKNRHARVIRGIQRDFIVSRGTVGTR